jgi:hypothetical protein
VLDVKRREEKAQLGIEKEKTRKLLMFCKDSEPERKRPEASFPVPSDLSRCQVNLRGRASRLLDGVIFSSLYYCAYASSASLSDEG